MKQSLCPRRERKVVLGNKRTSLMDIYVTNPSTKAQPCLSEEFTCGFSSNQNYSSFNHFIKHFQIFVSDSRIPSPHPKPVPLAGDELYGDFPSAIQTSHLVRSLRVLLSGGNHFRTKNLTNDLFFSD